MTAAVKTGFSNKGRKRCVVRFYKQNKKKSEKSGEEQVWQKVRCAHINEDHTTTQNFGKSFFKVHIQKNTIKCIMCLPFIQRY